MSSVHRFLYLSLLLSLALALKTHFTCSDGSLTIPYSFIDDNFCDCPDGSDEPTTNACAGISDSPTRSFRCPQEPLGAKYISFSKVNDGVKDCCDCSDEYEDPLCNKTCTDVAKKELASLKDEVYFLETALGVKKIMEEEGKKMVGDAKEHKLVLQKQKAFLEEIKQKVDDVSNQILIDEDLIEEEPLDSLVFVDSFDFISSQLELFEKQLLELKQLKENDLLSTITNKISQSTDLIKSKIVDLLKKVKIIKPSPHSEEVSLLQKKFTFIKENIETHEAILDELIKVSEVLNGKTCWLSATFDKEGKFNELLFKDSPYEYKFSLFKSAHQIENGKSVLLGKFDRFSFNQLSNQMTFTNGDYCWGGPHRSLTVDLKCAENTSIHGIREDSRCVYSMEVGSPCGCEEEVLEKISTRIKVIEPFVSGERDEL
ncbi:hypothetical protein P9112_009688 [Eukaryota sp. TZLM1-RC]